MNWASPGAADPHGNESNYLYGIKAGAPRIMKLLDDHQITATFTAAALALERAGAGRHRRRRSRGVQPWLALGPSVPHDEATERDFIEKATRRSNKPPARAGRLAVALFADREHRRLLLEAGYTYHMDDYSDDRFWETADGQPMLIMPYALDSNDMKMWTAPALSPADWLQYACDSFDWLYREGADCA